MTSVPVPSRAGLVLLLLLASLAGFTGCGKPEGAERAFTVRGVVRDFPAGGRALLIRHEDIPGYMPKMTMELTLADTNEARGLAIGDTIEFRLVARADDHFIDRIRRLGGETNGTPARTNAPSQAASTNPAPAAVRVAELKPGDPVPDLELLDEQGHALRLGELRGRAVAFTFFFTRCPLPDFCPRMNRNFREAREQLRRSGVGAANWLFLSISFDAEFDSPAVLKAHAGMYRGADPEGWRFASAGPAALATLLPAFDLKVTRDGGSFSHNLRTVVMDPRGRVHRQFDGNQWSPAELTKALTEAATVGTPAR